MHRDLVALEVRQAYQVGGEEKCSLTAQSNTVWRLLVKPSHCVVISVFNLKLNESGGKSVGGEMCSLHNLIFI